MYRFFSVSFILFVTLFFASCAEKPGDPSTTGLKQYVGNGFLFKYPGDATLDLKGENEWAIRTITLTGEALEVKISDYVLKTASFEVIIEFYDNPEKQSAADFAATKILNAYQTDIENDAPVGFWPVNESGEVDGFTKRVFGEPAWQASFFSGDHYMNRTFIANGKHVISVGCRSYPLGNNPIQPAWDAVCLYVMDSIRLERY